MNQKNTKTMANAVGATIGRPHFEGKTQKGITLIALVITIIVLLILAGVTISMVLGDDGIIQNAQAAKTATEKGNEKDLTAKAVTEAVMNTHIGQSALTLEEAQATFTTLTNTTYKKGVAKVVEGVPIPVGFAHVEGSKKDTGLIIVDGSGNEFVWVPVDNPNTFTTLTPGWHDGELIDGEGTEPTVVSTDDNEKNKAAILDADTYSDLSTQFTAEYNYMVTSVKIYGGFYVGRYETSWTGSKVASVSGAVPMNSSTPLEDWENSTGGNQARWYGLYKKQKELYERESNSSVVSGMIYGCQWDAIMNWMQDIDNPNVEGEKFIKNSKGMGWHDTNYSDGNPNHITGLDLNGGMNKVNNIYDLAGNCYEWTQEAYSIYRYTRGGGYDSQTRGWCGKTCI